MHEIEFEVAGVQYRAVRLDAFKQLHLSRKIAPVIPKLIPVFVRLQKAGAADDITSLADAAGPFAEALAAMPEADVDAIVKTCLASVRRNQSGAWAPLVANDTLMFADVGLETLLPLVARVLRENLGNFIRGLLEKMPAEAAPAGA